MTLKPGAELPAEQQPPRSITRIAQFKRPTKLGEYFDVHSWRMGEAIAYALVRGDVCREGVMVRVQSPCLFGESFGVNSCDCAAQLEMSLTRAVQEPSFLLVYVLSDEGRGHGHLIKTRAIALEANRNMEMTESYDHLGLQPDLREYEMAAAIVLAHIGDHPIRLLTNNPKKEDRLKSWGVTIAERLPLIVENPNAECRKYLNNKRLKMGHILEPFDP